MLRKNTKCQVLVQVLVDVVDTSAHMEGYDIILLERPHTLGKVQLHLAEKVDELLDILHLVSALYINIAESVCCIVPQTALYAVPRHKCNSCHKMVHQIADGILRKSTLAFHKIGTNTLEPLFYLLRISRLNSSVKAQLILERTPCKAVISLYI